MKFLLCTGIVAMLVSYTNVVGAEVEEVIVHASALRQQAGETVTPATIVTKDQIQNRLSTNIADVLATTPGVNNSGFGPGAGRPVIRGHGAARVRTLQGGADTFDAAGVSPDHAVTSDPFAAEAIEVLRGPATLAHGSGAVGGVVNTVDHAIPDRPLDGRAGRFITGASNGSDGRFSAAELQAGDGAWVGNVSGSISDADNIEIPDHAAVNPGAVGSAPSELGNSAVDTRAGSIGFSHHSDDGYWGLARERYATVYGVPTEDDVTIDLNQNRTRFSGEWGLPLDIMESLRVSAVDSEYQHRELEGAEIGTEYRVRGQALRVELAHAPVGDATGVVGLHLRSRKLRASGDEAFVPASTSESAALFLVEEVEHSETTTLEWGARFEQVRHAPESASTESFDLMSVSAGVRHDLSGNLVFASSVSHSERAPTSEELFANGVHVATNAFEIGDATLKTESAGHVDAALRWQGDEFSASVDVFFTRFNDFIVAQSQDCNADGVADRVDENFDGSCGAVISPAAPGHDEALLVSRQQQRDADYSGGEAQLGYRIATDNGATFGVTLFADAVRARFRDGGAVPRIPARRVGAGIEYESGGFSAGGSWVHAMLARNTALLETQTASWNQWDMYANWQVHGADTPWIIRARGINLTNDEIRNHTSFIKDDVPAPGRYFSFALEYLLP